MQLLERDLKAYVQQVPKLEGAIRCGEALKLMRQHPDADCAIVMEQESLPSGLLMVSRFFLHLIGPAGLDRYYDAPVRKLMSRALVVDQSCSLPEMLDQAVRRPLLNRFDSIVVMRGGTVAGVIASERLAQLLNECE